MLSLQRRQDHAISGSLSGEVFLWNLMTEQLTLRAQAAEGMAVNALAWERNVVLAACDMDVLVLENFVIRRVDQQDLPEVDREKYLSAFALD